MSFRCTAFLNLSGSSSRTMLFLASNSSPFSSRLNTLVTPMRSANFSCVMSKTRRQASAADVEEVHASPLWALLFAVLTAIEQVSNSLVASQKDREFREQQELLTQAAQQTDQLSEVLYKNGGASCLPKLTTEKKYFFSELQPVQTPPD